MDEQNISTTLFQVQFVDTDRFLVDESARLGQHYADEVFLDADKSRYSFVVGWKSVKGCHPVEPIKRTPIPTVQRSRLQINLLMRELHL